MKSLPFDMIALHIQAELPSLPGAPEHMLQHCWGNCMHCCRNAFTAIPAAPIVCRQHSGLCDVPTGGALLHFAHIVRNYLNETFPGRWIGRVSPRFWAACSRGLNALGLLCLGSHQDSGEWGSTAVGQAAACAPVTQRVRVRSPVGTGFLGEVFSGFFLLLKDKCREALGPKVPEYHLAIIIIITHHSLQAPMTWDVDAP